PETEATSLLSPLDSDDPGARLDAVVAAFTDLIADTEPQQRTMLRLSLEDNAGDHPPGLLRQGRAIRWITDALAPLRGTLPDDDSSAWFSPSGPPPASRPASGWSTSPA
ncbi:MAG: hypothetical protein ABWZ89_06050, partial [Acidimicrobiales bacterium]